MNGDLNSVIKDYEETMFLEAKKNRESHELLDICLGEDSPSSS